MTEAPESLRLRPATADDAEFAYRTTRNTMREYQVVEREQDSIRLAQLFILAEYQRRGIGSKLIGQLLADARSAGLPLRPRVLRVNPAFRLYQRMGFRVVEETPERYFMEHST